MKVKLALKAIGAAGATMTIYNVLTSGLALLDTVILGLTSLAIYLASKDEGLFKHKHSRHQKDEHFFIPVKHVQGGY